MGTKCAPLVEDLFLFCYHSDDKQADIIDAFNTTSRYLDILIISNIHFDNMARKDSSEIDRTYNIRRQQPRFKAVCS